MLIITLDFETYYTPQYSLSKMTTEEYIRSDLFEAIGVSAQVDDGIPEWFTGSMQETKNWLQKYPWADAMLVAHNAMFDAAILSWRFDVHPRIIADTLSMARARHGVSVGGSLKKLAEQYQIGVKGDEVINALGKRRLDFTPEDLARYGEYCRNDTALTYKLFDIFMETFPKAELKLIDLTLKMFTEPVLDLDALKLEQHLTDIVERKDALLAKVAGDPATAKANIMSNPKFAELLRGLNVEPPTKISPITKKETYAFAKTDEGMKALLEHEDVEVQALVGARLGVKSTLEETRTARFISIAGRGLLPIPLKYYAAHTGRWGGCLVADTGVVVFNIQNGVESKRIVDVLLDDLVWDGEAFVPHEGVVFSGYSEVVEWDGVKGTEDHVVFTDTGETSLREAMQGAHRITPAGSPTQNDVDAARKLVCNNKAKDMGSAYVCLGNSALI